MQAVNAGAGSLNHNLDTDKVDDPGGGLRDDLAETGDNETTIDLDQESSWSGWAWNVGSRFDQ